MNLQHDRYARQKGWLDISRYSFYGSGIALIVAYALSFWAIVLLLVPVVVAAASLTGLALYWTHRYFIDWQHSVGVRGEIAELEWRRRHPLKPRAPDRDD